VFGVGVGRRWGVCIPRGRAVHSVWRRGASEGRCVSGRYYSRWGRMVLGCGDFGVAWMLLVGDRSLTFAVLGWGCWGEH
jgi:hypothetical protein